jgi:acetylglutamate kinase
MFSLVGVSSALLASAMHLCTARIEDQEAHDQEVCHVGCLMSGNETATLVLESPGAVPVIQPLAFNKTTGVYEATITALEVLCQVPHVVIPASAYPHLKLAGRESTTLMCEM